MCQSYQKSKNEDHGDEAIYNLDACYSVVEQTNKLKDNDDTWNNEGNGVMNLDAMHVYIPKRKQKWEMTNIKAEAKYHNDKSDK